MNRRKIKTIIYKITKMSISTSSPKDRIRSRLHSIMWRVQSFPYVRCNSNWPKYRPFRDKGNSQGFLRWPLQMPDIREYRLPLSASPLYKVFLRVFRVQVLFFRVKTLNNDFNQIYERKRDSISLHESLYALFKPHLQSKRE